MEQKTPYDEAAEIGEAIRSEIELPDGWHVSDEEYPFEENVPDDFPDDYLRQFEVVGFTNGPSYVGVWWLREGERLQVYYDSNTFGEWSDVLDIDGVVSEIPERLKSEESF